MLPRPVLQSGFVGVTDGATAVGIVIEKEPLVTSQPLASFTVTVCDPPVTLPKLPDAW
jgi:hypothetical protein